MLCALYIITKDKDILLVHDQIDHCRLIKYQPTIFDHLQKYNQLVSL